MLRKSLSWLLCSKSEKLPTTLQKKKYYDLTTKISEKTVVYPGDPVFKSVNICSIKNGSKYSLCQMHLGNHTGTHIDFPAHVIEGGKQVMIFQ